MIHETTGDVLLSKAQLIAHGVAPNDGFHSGLALSLREEFPAMYKDFRHYCRTEAPKPGSIWVWSGAGPKGPVRIACLLTQEPASERGATPGRAKLEHVNHALRELRRFVDGEKIATIALPKLATGVGALEWEKVEPLVTKHLGSSPAAVYVYTTFHKGVTGVEKAPSKTASSL
jgi:O-acetyl-ADP-ribose deacetylase (regulator of RNase III)